MEIRLTPEIGLVTETIQRAIDECFLAGGGRVVLSEGLYTIGSVRLRSNVTLYLCAGATLKGTRDPKDYFAVETDTLEPIPQEYLTDVLWTPPRTRKTFDHITKAGSRWNHAMIRLLHAKNAGIIGEPGSVIDGSDCYDEEGEEHYRGPHGICFHYCEGLRFSGYTIRNTGNWAHLGYASQQISFSNVMVLGGHDGVHISICDDVSVERCEFYTGDDCVAGFDNERVTVRNCVLNTACSGLRFGGADILVENCRFYGPAKYFFRGSLSKEDKISGNPAPTEGRKTMLSLFTYYSDFSLNVRTLPKNIVIRNCVCENAERFLLYDFSGGQVWQKNRPLCEIFFENVTARNIKMPLDVYGDVDNPTELTMKSCRVEFAENTPAAMRAAHYARIMLQDTAFCNVEGPLVLSYGGDGEITLRNVAGGTETIAHADEPYSCKSI